MNRAADELELGVLTGSFTDRVDVRRLPGQLRAFFEALHGDESGSLAIVSGFLIGKKLHGITRRRFDWPDAFAEAATWIGHEAMIGRDVYHTGSVNSKGRGAGLNPVNTLAAEVDHRRLAALPEPTLVVESSPTLRQCYWRLNEPIAPEVANRLLARVGAALDQLLLVPAVPNNRFSGGPLIEIVSCSDRTYDLPDLARALPDLSTDPLAKGWHPLPQLKTSERLGQAAVAAATIAGSSAMKVSVAAVTAAIAVTGITSVGRGPEPSIEANGLGEARRTDVARIDLPGSAEVEVTIAYAAAGAPPASVAAPEAPVTTKGDVPQRKVTDVVADSPATTEVDSDPGAISEAATEPANEARTISLKLTDTQLEVISP